MSENDKCGLLSNTESMDIYPWDNNCLSYLGIIYRFA